MLRALLLSLALLATPLFAEPLRTLSWEELIPEGAPPPPPPQAFHDLSQLADALAAESGPAAQQAPAAPVVEALDGQQVRLPGYVVPLDVDSEGRVREFLLVPYFGACIHVPPPPSNQIVHVRTTQQLVLDDLWQPFWIEGKLRVEHSSSDLAEAGYQLQGERIRPYELPQE